MKNVPPCYERDVTNESEVVRHVTPVWPVLTQCEGELWPSFVQYLCKYGPHYCPAHWDYKLYKQLLQCKTGIVCYYLSGPNLIYHHFALEEVTKPLTVELRSVRLTLSNLVPVRRLM